MVHIQKKFLWDIPKQKPKFQASKHNHRNKNKRVPENQSSVNHSYDPSNNLNQFRYFYQIREKQRGLVQIPDKGRPIQRSEKRKTHRAPPPWNPQRAYKRSGGNHHQRTHKRLLATPQLSHYTNTPKPPRASRTQHRIPSPNPSAGTSPPSPSSPPPTRPWKTRSSPQECTGAPAPPGLRRPRSWRLWRSQTRGTRTPTRDSPKGAWEPRCPAEKPPRKGIRWWLRCSRCCYCHWSRWNRREQLCSPWSRETKRGFSERRRELRYRNRESGGKRIKKRHRICRERSQMEDEHDPAEKAR